MKIIAIDPGFERIGIAILEKNKNEESLLFSTCFKTSPREQFSERILAIGKKIEEIIEEYKPEILVIEKIFFSTNQKTVINVAEARGVIIFKASELGLKIYEYTPLEIKIAITGYGRATKEQINLMVQKLISLKKTIKSDDEMDAIAIGLTYFAYCHNYQMIDKKDFHR